MVVGRGPRMKMKSSEGRKKIDLTHYHNFNTINTRTRLVTSPHSVQYAVLRRSIVCMICMILCGRALCPMQPDTVRTLKTDLQIKLLSRSLPLSLPLNLSQRKSQPFLVDLHGLELCSVEKEVLVTGHCQSSTIQVSKSTLKNSRTFIPYLILVLLI